MSRDAPPSPSAVVTALAAPGRNPADLTLPTAGTQATDPAGEGGHETSQQSWYDWFWGGITSLGSAPPNVPGNGTMNSIE